MDTTRTDEFLAHYGIKGMKWGKRRTEKELRYASNEARDAHTLKTRKAHELTNDELQRVTTRLKLEKSFKEITHEPTKLEKGQKFVKTALGLTKSIDQIQKIISNKNVLSIKDSLQTAVPAAAKAAKNSPAFKVTPEARERTEKLLLGK